MLTLEICCPLMNKMRYHIPLHHICEEKRDEKTRYSVKSREEYVYSKLCKLTTPGSIEICLLSVCCIQC